MEVRLFASLREGRGKTAQVDWFDGITGHAILENIGIPTTDVAIYLINGKNANLEDGLSQDDVVSFFPPVGGG